MIWCKEHKIYNCIMSHKGINVVANKKLEDYSLAELQAAIEKKNRNEKTTQLLKALRQLDQLASEVLGAQDRARFNSLVENLKNKLDEN